MESSSGGGQAGKESADAPKPTPKNVVATIEVEETEYELNPANPGVEDAGKVAFEVTNAGKIGHALEVEGPEGEVKTKEIAPGDTAKFTADLSKPGKYKWYCPIADHEEQGMTGSVFVAFDKAGQTDQPRKKGEAGPGSDGHGGY
ncbi:MAG: cupredoxin domain-containing protein [Thermoleophilaceae bacterium]|nr:cupredoxin domain-containing protein [Thermoleophilaceae bacterium]